MSFKWHHDAKCKDLSPDERDVFFPEQGDGQAIRKAKTVCFGLDDGTPCPVLQTCRDWGIKREEHGVWGGLSAEERRHLRRGTKWERSPVAVAQAAKKGSGNEGASPNGISHRGNGLSHLSNSEYLAQFNDEPHRNAEAGPVQSPAGNGKTSGANSGEQESVIATTATLTLTPPIPALTTSVFVPIGSLHRVDSDSPASDSRPVPHRRKPFSRRRVPGKPVSTISLQQDRLRWRWVWGALPTWNAMVARTREGLRLSGSEHLRPGSERDGECQDDS